MDNVGLIGYGVMGKAIAKNLMNSNYQVFVYEKTR